MTQVALIQRYPGCWIGNAGDPSFLGYLLLFDATLKENHKSKNVITRQPVEKGVDITDHVRPEPDEIDLDAIITNTPIIAPGEDHTAAASSAYRTLLDLKNRATFLSVSTSLRDYDNMIISSLSVDRDVKTGQVLAVKVSFQSVLVVSSQQVPIPFKKSATKKRKGNVPGKDADGATAKKGASNFRKLADAGLKVAQSL